MLKEKDHTLFKILKWKCTVSEVSKKGITVNAVGDISLGDHPVCAGHGMRNAFKRHGSKIFDSINPYMDSESINLCNLETIASDVGLKGFWLPSYEMRGKSADLRRLKEAGFNLVGVANNHAMHHGKKAFLDMLDHLKSEGLNVIGVDQLNGKTGVHEVNHDDVVSYFVGYSLRPEERAQGKVPYSLREQVVDLISEVKELRQRCTGFLVCSIHWGLEFLDYPSAEQVEIAHKLVDAGVNVVIGHHPHVLQPIEEYNNGLIFYSLGNFVFDLWPVETKLTAIAHIKLELGKTPTFSVTPVTIDKDLCLRLSSEEERHKIEKLISWSRLNETEFYKCSQTEYLERYKAERLKFRYSSYRYFFRNLSRYPLHFLAQSLGRTALRRLLGL